MKGIVPDAVLNRRDKVAFQPPQDRWLRETEETWRRLSMRNRAEEYGLLASGAMSTAIDAFMAGSSSSNVLWRVINLELWLRGDQDDLA